MEILLTGKQSQQLDAHTIHETGIPSLVLMERASLAAAHEAQELCKEICGRRPRIAAVCGSGNNGGDGIAAARILAERGYDVDILIVCREEKMSGDGRTQAKIARNLGLPVLYMKSPDEIELDRYDLIIDALFGTGLSRDIGGSFALWIGQINQAKDRGHTKILAIDIPSGIHSADGKVMGCAVKADCSVTFGYRKPGMLLYPGRDYCGRVVCARIGFDRSYTDQLRPEYFTCTPRDLMKIPGRREDSHKGTFGKVLVIAGSRNMAGAACLSAQAAFRTGAGLITIYTPECNRVILQTLVPEAVMKTYPEEDTQFAGLDELLGAADAAVLGPGLGLSAASHELTERVVRQASCPLIVDADALNIAAENRQLLKQAHVPLILTPHRMEISRLTGDNIQSIQKNTREICEKFCTEYGVICIAKGAGTMIFGLCTDEKTGKYGNSSRIYLNTSGNSGMACGGSGDVLTGIIAGLAAQGMDPAAASVLGVYLHGLAGDAAAAEKGEYSMLSSDIVRNLSQVLPRRQNADR